MRPLVYIETSIISYLAAYPSRDLIAAARQQMTDVWWRRRRPEFDLFVSELVRLESALGDPDAARRRGELIADLPVLDITADSEALAALLMREVPLADQAAADALHIAIATTHGMQYLLTWNAKHIANAELRPRVERACRRAGYEPPVLCTPDELMGE